MSDGEAPRSTSERRRRRRAIVVLVGVLALLLGAVPAAGAASPAAESAAAWTKASPSAARGTAARTPLVDPADFAAFTLDQAALRSVLVDAPKERLRGTAPTPLTVSVPTPDGDFERFAITDSPVMEPGLAAAHPEIRTYAGRSLEHPGDTVRLDLTPLGFHASVRGDGRSWYVDPRFSDQSQYVAYDRASRTDDPLEGAVEREPDGSVAAPVPDAARRAPGGSAVQLRTYRLALLSDPTYAAYAARSGGTTTAAKVVLMNRVNQLYESDFAIRMLLIAGNDKLNLDTDAQATGANGPCGTTPCFTTDQLASCTDTTLTRTAFVAGLLAGAKTFDIGHLALGKSGGGIAALGVVGRTEKAQGCTGVPTPVGDFYAVDYVAHEMGHQFGGGHTFNGTQGNCSGTNRARNTSIEPGSGSTVMAYAGICGTDDLQVHSDPYFSGASIEQMTTYVSGAEANASSVQQVALTAFDGTDRLALTYDGQRSADIVNGPTTYTAARIEGAIEGIPGWPAGATVTVAGLADGTFGTNGFQVTFGGTLANRVVADLAVVDPASGVRGDWSGVAGETTAGGPTTRRGAVSATANRVPSVSTAAAFTVPARTPFTLDAAGSDLDGDALTYLWEQNDLGGATGTGLVSNTKTNGPLFRVFGTAARYSDAAALLSPSPGQNAATSTTSRTFPDMAQILAGNTNAATGTCPTVATGATAVPNSTVDCYSEFLPTAAWTGTALDRTMHFRVLARDGRTGAGGVGSAQTALTVAPAAGPFRLTSQTANATGVGGDPLPVTWDVANTNAAPVSAANVRITLSTDGGATFSRVLAESTPNDGSETVELPRLRTTQGRIRVEAVGNVFFDASRGALTITATGPVLNGPGGTQDLGASDVGVAGTTRTLTFFNDGTAPVAIGAAALGGPNAASFAVVADACSNTTLAVGASCTVQVRMTPATPGAQSASFTVPSGDPESPVTVALAGTGTTPPPAPTTTAAPAAATPVAPTPPAAATPLAPTQPLAPVVPTTSTTPTVVVALDPRISLARAPRAVRLDSKRTFVYSFRARPRAKGRLTIVTVKRITTGTGSRRVVERITLKTISWTASTKGVVRVGVKLTTTNARLVKRLKAVSTTVTATSGTKKATKRLTVRPARTTRS